jgi:group I intron endonuclease
MSYIYKITNKINGKVYIGKTNYTTEKRFREHQNDYKKIRNEKRPLYSAMNKYGIENFEIEELEKCEVEESEEREKYWIKYYDSYKNGYNATSGGDGKSYIDRQKVIDTYKEVQNQKEVARILNICTDSVHDILKQNNVPIKSAKDVRRALTDKTVAMIDMKTLETLNVFNSIREAESFLNVSYHSHIAEVCRGKRKSSLGYFWKYV